MIRPEIFETLGEHALFANRARVVGAVATSGQSDELDQPRFSQVFLWRLGGKQGCMYRTEASVLETFADFGRGLVPFSSHAHGQVCGGHMHRRMAPGRMVVAAANGVSSINVVSEP